MIDIVHGWFNDLKRPNNNTYKFALGLSILELVNKGKYEEKAKFLEIKIVDIFKEYIKFYWDNTAIFLLKESVSQKQEPIIIGEIKKLIESSKFPVVPTSNKKFKLNVVTETILKGNKGLLKKILQNPISRLQHESTNDPRVGGGCPEGKGWLYDWDMSEGVIKLKGSYKKDIIEKRLILESLTISFWARFIERYNTSPSIANKITPNKVRKGISNKYKEILLKVSGGKCFYCETPSNEKFDIDHFIPHEFIFANYIWNLVFCCPDCNRGEGGKFAKLPEKRFIEKLREQNDKLFDNSNLTLKEEFFDRGALNQKINELYNVCLLNGYKVFKILS